MRWPRKFGQAGNDVTVWNRTSGQTGGGGAQRRESSRSLRMAQKYCGCASPILDAVESVLFGREGVESFLREGMIVADSSTISPAATAKFAERVQAKGVSYVDAPMTGSKVGAQNGTLVFLSWAETKPALNGSNRFLLPWERKIFRMGEDQ